MFAARYQKQTGNVFRDIIVLFLYVLNKVLSEPDETDLLISN